MTYHVTTESTVEFIDKLGTDLTVVNAARVSFDKHSEDFGSGDDKLLRYLADHDHWSPFAHAQLQVRITAPIFVARQLVKHQIGLVWNEVSRRYVTDDPTFYLPKVWRGKPTQGAKQGSDGEVQISRSMMSKINGLMTLSTEVYNNLMDEGVCAEQARMFLLLSLMTSWYWTGSLYAIARVCRLRLDPHAQGEAREVGLQLAMIAEQHFPRAWEKLVPLTSEA
jgi:thymidylate synthase (FAD)